jgi:hypothetical protein
MTGRELATILVALRHFQESTREDERGHWEHFDGTRPMNDEQIDWLCEQMNTTGWAALKRIKLTGIS